MASRLRLDITVIGALLVLGLAGCKAKPVLDSSAKGLVDQKGNIMGRVKLRNTIGLESGWGLALCEYKGDVKAAPGTRIDIDPHLIVNCLVSPFVKPDGSAILFKETALLPASRMRAKIDGAVRAAQTSMKAAVDQYQALIVELNNDDALVSIGVSVDQPQAWDIDQTGAEMASTIYLANLQTAGVKPSGAGVAPADIERYLFSPTEIAFSAVERDAYEGVNAPKAGVVADLGDALYMIADSLGGVLTAKAKARFNNQTPFRSAIAAKNQAWQASFDEPLRGLNEKLQKKLAYEAEEKKKYEARKAEEARLKKLEEERLAREAAEKAEAERKAAEEKLRADRAKFVPDAVYKEDKADACPYALTIQFRDKTALIDAVHMQGVPDKANTEKCVNNKVILYHTGCKEAEGKTSCFFTKQEWGTYEVILEPGKLTDFVWRTKAGDRKMLKIDELPKDYKPAPPPQEAPAQQQGQQQGQQPQTYQAQPGVGQGAAYGDPNQNQPGLPSQGQ
jgi:hypothetical protein